MKFNFILILSTYIFVHILLIFTVRCFGEFLEMTDGKIAEWQKQDTPVIGTEELLEEKKDTLLTRYVFLIHLNGQNLSQQISLLDNLFAFIFYL